MTNCKLNILWLPGDVMPSDDPLDAHHLDELEDEAELQRSAALLNLLRNHELVLTDF